MRKISTEWRKVSDTASACDFINSHGVVIARIVREDYVLGRRRVSHVTLDDVGCAYFMEPMKPYYAEQLAQWFAGMQTVAVYDPSTPRDQSVFRGGNEYGSVGPVPTAVIDATLPSLVALARRALADRKKGRP